MTVKLALATLCRGRAVLLPLWLSFCTAQSAETIHWRFESEPGFTADSGSGGHTLNPIGETPISANLNAEGKKFPTVLSSPALRNQAAARFNGKGHFEATPKLPLDGTFSVEAFIHRGTTTAGSSYLISQWRANDTGRSWGIAIAGHQPPAGMAAGELFFNASSDGREVVPLASGLVIKQGQDYYITVTFRAGADDGMVRFQVCELSAAGSLVTTLLKHRVARLHPATEPLRIGAFNGDHGRWHGLIDELRITPAAVNESKRLIAGLPEDTPITLTTPTAVNAATLEAPPWPLLGKIQPRHSHEITSSTWSVGGETIDRKFAIYKNYRDYLGPLGVKAIRLQAGWARTETTKGRYDWAWLDEPVRDAAAQGVSPWINVSYGNSIYEGGGGTGLHATAPSSQEAKDAWDRWLAAMVTRYKDVVTEWEIWNEPYGNVTAEEYAELYIRSAKIIRRIQPEAHLIALSLAGISLDYVETLLIALRDQNLLDHINEISYHAYIYVPEQHYPQVDALRALAKRYHPAIGVRQGENGAPSVGGGFGALTAREWSENTQAKWNLRRMMGDHGRGIPNSIFSIIDMHYPNRINNKGLLMSLNKEQTVDRPKMAYHAAQNVYSIFDDTLERVSPFARQSSFPASRLQVFGYRHRTTGRSLVTLWFGGAEVTELNLKTPGSLTLDKADFKEPVWIDLRSGEVYAIPASNWSLLGTKVSFTELPVYDSPVAIADRSLIRVK